MTNRWWIYQKTRFPIFAHGPMVVIFCLSVMLFSSLQHGEIPDLGRIAGAVISTLILFFQLRVADEFKDFDIDSEFRPHRPVPSGLITLPELAGLAWLGAAIQLYIAISTDIGLVPVLMLVWLYMGLMTKEFFVPEWLKRTPSVYLVSHMLVMPIIAFYISAFDWLCECREMPAGLGWLLLLSFCCGLVLELGRKIKSPAAEREGVETYSALWGTGISVSLWAASVAIAVGAYSRAYELITNSHLNMSIGIGVGILVLCFTLIAALLFRTNAGHPGTAKMIEPVSGVVAMLLYIGLGPLQALLS
jgi:4-hydroxybenzoate polyprenyltransferase